MINPHPPLSSFPIALLITCLLLEMLSRWFYRQRFREAAALLFWFGGASAVLTYFSGYLAVSHANKSFLVPPELIAAHQASARFILLLLIPCAFLRLGDVNQQCKARMCYLILLWCVVAVLIWTGFQGGRLVFSYGAAVELRGARSEGSASDEGSASGVSDSAVSANDDAREGERTQD